MTREIKMFKKKTDGFNPDVKLNQVRKNRPAKTFKHFAGDDWKDSWEIDREVGMGSDDAEHVDDGYIALDRSGLTA